MIVLYMLSLKYFNVKSLLNSQSAKINDFIGCVELFFDLSFSCINLFFLFISIVKYNYYATAQSELNV